MTEFDWQALEELGYLSGHVLCRCPRCGEFCMTAYTAKASPWPECRVCLPEPAPRVECISDLDKMICKTPGEPPNKTLLKSSGRIERSQVAHRVVWSQEIYSAGDPIIR